MLDLATKQNSTVQTKRTHFQIFVLKSRMPDLLVDVLPKMESIFFKKNQLMVESIRKGKDPTYYKIIWELLFLFRSKYQVSIILAAIPTDAKPQIRERKFSHSF